MNPRLDCPLCGVFMNRRQFTRLVFDCPTCGSTLFAAGHEGHEHADFVNNRLNELTPLRKLLRAVKIIS